MWGLTPRSGHACGAEASSGKAATQRQLVRHCFRLSHRRQASKLPGLSLFSSIAPSAVLPSFVPPSSRFPSHRFSRVVCLGVSLSLRFLLALLLRRASSSISSSSFVRRRHCDALWRSLHVRSFGIWPWRPMRVCCASERPHIAARVAVAARSDQRSTARISPGFCDAEVATGQYPHWVFETLGRGYMFATWKCLCLILKCGQASRWWGHLGGRTCSLALRLGGPQLPLGPPTSMGREHARPASTRGGAVAGTRVEAAAQHRCGGEAVTLGVGGPCSVRGRLLGARRACERVRGAGRCREGGRQRWRVNGARTSRVRGLRRRSSRHPARARRRAHAVSGVGRLRDLCAPYSPSWRDDDGDGSSQWRPQRSDVADVHDRAHGDGAVRRHLVATASRLAAVSHVAEGVGARRPQAGRARASSASGSALGAGSLEEDQHLPSDVARAEVVAVVVCSLSRWRMSTES